MRKILQVIKVSGTSHEAVMRAVEMENFGDFEDCLQDSGKIRMKNQRDQVAYFIKKFKM